MKMINLVLVSILALAVIAIAGFAVLGPTRVWGLFGPSDLGAVDFERLVRRSTPNDALACPAALCPARIDLEPAVYAVDAARLRKALTDVIAGEPRTERVATDDGAMIDRYVQRTAILGFPDTIVVRFVPQAADRSTVAIYSRSQLGRSDLGTNKARIDRWLAKLAQQVPIAR